MSESRLETGGRPAKGWQTRLGEDAQGCGQSVFVLILFPAREYSQQFQLQYPKHWKQPQGNYAVFKKLEKGVHTQLIS